MDGVLLGDEFAQTVEDRLEMLDGRWKVEDRLERGAVQMRSDLGVGLDEGAEVALLAPCRHRVSLDDPVGPGAAGPPLDECEQEPMGEEEAVGGIEVPQHPLRVDDEPLDDPREAV